MRFMRGNLSNIQPAFMAKATAAYTKAHLEQSNIYIEAHHTAYMACVAYFFLLQYCQYRANGTQTQLLAIWYNKAAAEKPHTTQPV